MSFIDPQSLARIPMTVDAGAKTLDIGVKQPFRLWLPDAANPGSYIEKTITAPAQIKGYGHGSANFKTSYMGQTSTVGWLENFPYYWYLTIESGTAYWVGTRNPCMKQLPASENNITSFAAGAGAPSQNDVFIAASITAADFVNLPAFGPIGSMPLQRAANGNESTLIALTAGQDGFGCYQEGVDFDFVPGQNGADAGSYFSVGGGGTGPTYTTENVSFYTLSLGGMLHHSGAHENAAGGTAGAGAGNLFCHLPYSVVSTYNSAVYFPGRGYSDESGGVRKFALLSSGTGNPYFRCEKTNTDSPLVFLNGNDQGDASRTMKWSIIVKVFS